MSHQKRAQSADFTRFSKAKVASTAPPTTSSTASPSPHHHHHHHQQHPIIIPRFSPPHSSLSQYNDHNYYQHSYQQYRATTTTITTTTTDTTLEQQQQQQQQRPQTSSIMKRRTQSATPKRKSITHTNNNHNNHNHNHHHHQHRSSPLQPLQSHSSSALVPHHHHSSHHTNQKKSPQQAQKQHGASPYHNKSQNNGQSHSGNSAGSASSGGNQMIQYSPLSSRSELRQLEIKFRHVATLLKLPSIDQHYYLKSFVYSPNPKPQYMALIIDMLMLHKSKTVEVFRSINEREKVWDMIFDLINAHSLNVTSEEMKKIQKSAIKLLTQLQRTSLVVVENIMRWRQNLTRPFAFCCFSHGNYLVKMKRDCEYFDNSTLANNLFTSFERSGYLLSRFSCLDVRDDSPFDQIERKYSPMVEVLAPKLPSSKSNSSPSNDLSSSKKMLKRLQKAETIIKNEEDIQMVLHMDYQQKKKRQMFIPVLDTRNILPNCKDGIPIGVPSTSVDSNNNNTSSERLHQAMVDEEEQHHHEEEDPEELSPIENPSDQGEHIMTPSGEALPQSFSNGDGSKPMNNENHVITSEDVAVLYSNMPLSPVQSISTKEDASFELQEKQQRQQPDTTTTMQEKQAEEPKRKEETHDEHLVQEPKTSPYDSLTIELDGTRNQLHDSVVEELPSAIIHNSTIPTPTGVTEIKSNVEAPSPIAANAIDSSATHAKEESFADLDIDEEFVDLDDTYDL